MLDREYLRSELIRLDNFSYKAYKDIKGSYDFQDFILIIERVQGDPFALPSKIRVKIPQSIAGFPQDLYQSPSREIALGDYLTREFDKYARQLSAYRGTGKSGLITITSIGQEVLKRTSVSIDDNFVEARFLVGLPARGRRILGYQALSMLCEDIPDIVNSSLKYSSLNPDRMENHIKTVEDADSLRQQLKEKDLVAFIANGAILPRKSGVDKTPLESDSVVPFVSPKSLEIELSCPNQGKVKGMGIPSGITLIVGGGYHGKSTLLKAIELGVYNHIPGDGREFVVTNPTAVKIRAEDGRSVVSVNISPFINQLPQNLPTTTFSTSNASGSTSQAANIIEALEIGTELLLLDEDTSATNFMIRDRRMQQLISKDKEPITPFIDKVKQLYTDYGVSTILVTGGSGDYFDVADTVIAMDNFQAFDVTTKAKEIANQYTSDRSFEGGQEFGKITPRIPLLESVDPSRGNKSVKFKVKNVDGVFFGTEDIDLGAVEQIVSPCQLRAIACALVYIQKKYRSKKETLFSLIQLVMNEINSEGLDVLTDFPEGDLAIFRPCELAAAFNRLRSLKVD